MKTSLIKKFQKQLDKHNRLLAANQAFIDSIIAQNQAGAKSGPIAISSLIPKEK